MSGVRRSRALGVLGCAALVAATLWLVSCSKQSLISAPVVNQRPTLRITQAPAVPTQPYFYAYEIRWAGFDADGRIDHFRYAIDPPTVVNSDTVWTNTTDNRGSFEFRSDSLDSSTDKTALGYHTIVIEAIDDRGAFSAPETRSFTTFTVAPTVKITNPVLNALFHPELPPSIHVDWQGFDPDGRLSSRPVKYKWHLFSPSDPLCPWATVLEGGDSLRLRFAPHFSQWDSVGGDTTSLSITNLVPGGTPYILAIVAIDEAGAYSPIMSQDTNLLFFTCLISDAGKPAFTIFGDGFYNAATTGGFYPDKPATYVKVDLAAGRPIPVSWFATPAKGSFISGYRWMLDGTVDDETPRSIEDADLVHWSQWSALTTTIKLPPTSPPPGQSAQTHFLYVEAQDNNGIRSLVVLQFTVVQPTFDKDLLFVDDTRRQTDHPIVGGCVDRPKDVWPSAAELDTFLFARGGRPWKCYPAGTVSPIGMFAGYSYDTVGTRFLPNGQVSLEMLGHYKHIVWYVDNTGANYADPQDPRNPETNLRYFSSPLRTNPLGTWVSQGGKLWLMGGGSAMASLINWNATGTTTDLYSHDAGELVPGRLMYDLAGWRSEISVKSIGQIQRAAARNAPWPGQPDYSKLTDYLFEKSEATDPISVYAPYRTNSNDYFQGQFIGEALTKPNAVVEDLSDDPAKTAFASTLDTLYETAGGVLGIGRPVMTIYHGPNYPPVVFSGFPLWFWRRDDAIKIADLILQDLWGVPRQNVPR